MVERPVEFNKFFHSLSATTFSREFGKTTFVIGMKYVSD